jgi:hypothetical protein
MQQQYKCGSCGTIVRSGARFCRNCGAQLGWPTEKQPQQQQGFQHGKAQAEHQTAECPTCGAQIPSGLRFCDNCGVQLRWEAKQKQPPEQQQTYQHVHIQKENKKTNSGLIVSIILIVSALLLIGGVVVFNMVSQNTQSSSAPTATPSTAPPTSLPAVTPSTAPPTASPTVIPPTAPLDNIKTSYLATTYTNDKYGFSIQYPKDWVPQPEFVNNVVVAAFSVSAFIPGISISVADVDGPLTAEWIVAQTNSLPDTSGSTVTSDITPTTLDDGTPASQYTLKYTYQSYEIQAFGVSTDRNNKRIRTWVWTIDAFAPYDETLFSEIAHTLTFSQP